ncbi:MAG: hypothetical protein LBQ76_00455 [Candidatus Fibromonas sp.]|jgi:hypothetical protein|nr:hypothetical protein [Candidatus Fibromonas sp.]
MPSKKPVAEKAKGTKEPVKKNSKNAVAKKAKKAASASIPKAKTGTKKTPASKAPQVKIESSLMIQGAKFVKTPFFFDAEKEERLGKRKQLALPKSVEKPTAWSRPKIGNSTDSKNLVELLSQQLEYENRTYFEGCEGQICVKCNVNNVDQKFYVNKSLGYCTECATLLDLGQSKEGVFSDAQIELMRRSMERSMQKTKDLDENDLESALDDMDELEEALLAVEEASEFNV